jgi:hypothetical protein
MAAGADPRVLVLERVAHAGVAVGDLVEVAPDLAGRRSVAVVSLNGRDVRSRRVARRAGVRDRDLVLAGAEGGEQRVEGGLGYRDERLEHALQRRTSGVHGGIEPLGSRMGFTPTRLLSQQTKWLIITLLIKLKVIINHFVICSIYLLKNSFGSYKKPIDKVLITIL